jgi:predicted permease
VLDVRLTDKVHGYKDIDYKTYYRELNDRISALPHVTSSAIVHMQPGAINSWTQEVRPKGTTAAPLKVDFDMVMPGAFHTMGIALLRGRDFSWQDDKHSPHVAIVSRSFAEQALHGKDPIGESIEVPSQPKWGSAQIIGIAADASLYDMRKHAPPTVYVPPLQYDDYSGWSEILIQTDTSAAAMTTPVQRVVESMGREYITRVEDLSTGIDRALLRERITAMLSTFFGGLALLLAAIGLYGLMAYNVTRRTREIGIRMALGAERGSVWWLILRETLLLACIGIVIGVPVALAGSRLIAPLLYGASIKDPRILLSVCGILLAVAGAAGWLPARRATRVDPMVALRYE